MNRIFFTFFFIILTILCWKAILNPQKTLYYLDKFSAKKTYYLENLFKKDSNTIYVKSSDNYKYISPYKNSLKMLHYSGSFLFFNYENETSLEKIAQYTIKYTQFLKLKNFIKTITNYNEGNKEIVASHETIYIPYSLPVLIKKKNITTKKIPPFTRGLYYTGYSISNNSILKNIIEYKKYGINTVVFDAKDIPGILSYFSELPEVHKLNTHAKRSIDNIDRLIEYLQSNGIYVIARIAVFQDHLLVNKRPELAIQSFKSKKIWNAGKKEIWCDPTNKEVQDYNIKIATELAQKGIDEIQFDYIRFPTVGDQKDANFIYSYGKMSRDKVITLFLKRARQSLDKYKVNLSIDIFGIVAWESKIDIKKTGQKIELLSKYCDVISPMLYPSHFNDNFRGHENPGDHPYYFINEGSLRVKKKANKTLVRPWLQAFGWRVSNYNADYIIKQIQASNDARAKGFLFWNASNSYDTVIRALKRLNNKD